MVNPKNIIVRMPNWIGDAVMATPILHDLRKKFPNSKLTALCQGAIGQLFTNDKNLDEVISFQKPSGWIHHLRLHPFVEDLRKAEYDTGILLTNSFSSAWWFYKGKVKNRIGFAGFRSCILNVSVPAPTNTEKEHLSETYKQLLTPLGIEHSTSKPYLVVTEQEQKTARKRLASLGVPPDAILIGINPGAAYGSAKCWLPERFTKVSSELLQNPNLWVIYFGDTKGRPLIEEITKGLEGRIINLAARTNLRELMGTLSLLDVLLTNDSGPMHMASALKIPVVALFGSTNSTKTGPFLPSIVHQSTVSCSPCYKRTCPIDFRCMKGIETDEVTDSILKLLKDTPK